MHPFRASNLFIKSLKPFMIAHYHLGKIKIYSRAIRLDHWFKNFFLLVGIIAAIAFSKTPFGLPLILKSILAILLGCLMSSVNYVINEIVDARFDKIHPNKRNRPVASGNVSIRKLILFDIGLFVFTITVSYLAFNEKFFFTMILFFIIGGICYNLPPIRTKDVPYIDIISESANNPLRLLLGWYAITNTVEIPLTGVVSYWTLGATLVTAKRIAELQFLGQSSIQYRPTFKYYDKTWLTIVYFFFIVSTLASFALLSFKYKYQLLYLFPFLIIFFIWFTFFTFQENSIVKEPEKLFEKKAFFTYCLLVLFIFSWSLFI